MNNLLSIETAFLSLPQVKQGLNLSEIRSVQRTITNAKKKKFEQMAPAEPDGDGRRDLGIAAANPSRREKRKAACQNHQGTSQMQPDGPAIHASGQSKGDETRN